MQDFMTDTTRSRMYLTAAMLLVVAEILLLAFGNAGLPISGLVLFAMFYGFAFAVNSDVRMLPIDGGDGCVEPTPDTIASNEYPISRDLWIYVNADKLADNPATVAYVDFYVSDILSTAVSDAKYVPLTADSQAETADGWKMIFDSLVKVLS